MTYKTEQEEFWSGEFGDQYTNRNNGGQLVVSNIAMFSRILKSAPGIESIVELGCNIGLNLQALNGINQKFELCGYEINKNSARQARDLGIADIVEMSILEKISTKKRYDLAFTKGVLIHINPDYLSEVYGNIVDLSSRYILVCEYYNPDPVMVSYRGNENRLFKRDFSGELMEKYNLRLLDYGFVYRRDNYFPQDDMTWFLLEK